MVLSIAGICSDKGEISETRMRTRWGGGPSGEDRGKWWTVGMRSL